MLYISRFVDSNLYGVVDTDDGVEEIVPRRDIGVALGDYNMDIAGVSYSLTTDNYRFIRAIVPYQAHETMTPLQAKTNLLHHVNVKLYNNILTNVLWRAEEITSPVVLRLSDFSVDCADRILFGNTESAVDKVTLLLDDSVNLSEFTFMTPVKLLGRKCGLGVTLDFRCLSNDKAIIAYNSLPQSMRHSEIRKTVLDFPSRQDSLLQCRIVDDEWRV